MSELILNRDVQLLGQRAQSAASTNVARLAKAYGWLCFEIWLLIALGGGVRAMNAGLACPDWPLCFGDVIPDYHPQVYFEFLHRVMAGAVAIVSLILAIWAWRTPKVSRGVKTLSVVSLVLLAAQIILGGLTVILLLHEKVVVGHLMLAGAFLVINLWIYLRLKADAGLARPVKVQVKGFAAFSRGVFALVIAQMTLGGLVASHYAALVCTDFPLCHGQWVPTLKGILGLHVMHRLGAYITGLAVIGLAIWAWRRRAELGAGMTRASLWMAAVVAWQILVGIANVVFYTPPLITVIHLASGMALLGLSARQLFLLQNSFDRV